MQQTDLGLLEVNEAVEAVQRLIEQSVLSEEPGKPRAPLQVL